MASIGRWFSPHLRKTAPACHMGNPGENLAGALGYAPLWGAGSAAELKGWLWGLYPPRREGGRFSTGAPWTESPKCPALRTILRLGIPLTKQICPASLMVHTSRPARGITRAPEAPGNRPHHNQSLRSGPGH